MCGKWYFIFENYFSENEIIKNWSMAVGMWSFSCKLQSPIIWVFFKTFHNSKNWTYWLNCKETVSLNVFGSSTETGTVVLPWISFETLQLFCLGPRFDPNFSVKRIRKRLLNLTTLIDHSDLMYLVLLPLLLPLWESILTKPTFTVLPVAEKWMREGEKTSYEIIHIHIEFREFWDLTPKWSLLKS